MREPELREFMARVLRKERLTSLFDKKKISKHEYIQAIDKIRAEQGLPPEDAEAHRIPCCHIRH